MRRRRIVLIGSLGLVLCALVIWHLTRPRQAEGPGEHVFKMREVSVFEKSDIPDSSELARGQLVWCMMEPDKEVRAYPKLNSKQPVYGKVTFDHSPYDPHENKGIVFYFVLDESGEVASDKTKKTDRYDRLYFDVNRDLDLTNDPVLTPMTDPPAHDMRLAGTIEQIAMFDHLDVPFDYGPGVGLRPFPILAHFVVVRWESNKLDRCISFIASKARLGQIRIGKHRYDALMGQEFFITGRFDRLFTKVFLKPLDRSEKLPTWGWSDDCVSFMRWIDGELYRTVASPLGDTLTVEPYRGDYGLFEVGPGGRNVKDISMRGDLHSQSASVGVGSPISQSGTPQTKVRTSQVPVGDYLAECLVIDYGRLHIRISDNYHSDGKRCDWDRPKTFGIHIRKDRPFVLDFSNKPAVLFTSPTKDQTVKPGEEIQVAAVLVDPKLDFMIREVQDTQRKEKKTVDLGSGKTRTYERDLSLDPIVKITDSAGKVVAEGRMPFG